jgi:hypothetical protein
MPTLLLLNLLCPMAIAAEVLIAIHQTSVYLWSGSFFNLPY